MYPLTTLQRRVATRFSRLILDTTGEQVARDIGTAAQAVFTEPRFAQFLIQLHLKHAEMSKALISSFRNGLFSPTAALTRPLLEGATKLCWAAIPDGIDERRTRLLRLLVTAYRDLTDQGFELPHGELRLIEEADRLRLGRAPDARSAMQSVDRVGARLGQPPFLEGHYNQFIVSSEQIHVHLAGPAVFRVDDRTNDMVINVEARILLGFSSLRYAVYYFALATQAISLLVGLDQLGSLVVRRYEALVGEADAEVQRLMDEGQP